MDHNAEQPPEAFKKQYPTDEAHFYVPARINGTHPITRRSMIVSSLCAGALSSLPKTTQGQEPSLAGIKAMTFDVYGTCTDFRGTIVREGADINTRKGIHIDWASFAHEWRALYQPKFDAILAGKQSWRSCTGIRREALSELIEQKGITTFTTSELDGLNGVWERVQPWPDVIPALLRLKKKYILSSLSNADMRTMVHLAKNRELPWDVVLAAELAHDLKPNAAVYKIALDYLGFEPGNILMVACHKFDLHGAKEQGFRTAFISRPLELGPGKADSSFDPAFDFNFPSFTELANQFGA